MRSGQSDVVHQDDRVTALVSLHQFPNNHANVIIVPNEHFENIFDLPVGYAEDVQRIARQIALAMKAAYGCDGVTLRQHNEPAGGQDVWHYHVHVTPRYHGDNFYLSRGEVMAPGERAGHARRLREALGRDR